MTSPPDKTKFHTSHSHKSERPQISRTLSQQISVEIPLVLGINSAQFSPRWCLCEPNSILSLTSFSTVVLKTKTFKRWSDWWWLFTPFDRKPTYFPRKTFQPWSDWWWLFTSFDRRLICFLSIPLSSRQLIMRCPWLCACRYWVLSSSALPIFPDTRHLGIN